MVSTANSQCQLYVIGLGIKIPDHSTVQALAAISRCDRIFTIVQEPPSRWLPISRKPDLQVSNLLDLYVEGALRTSNYDRVTATILAAVGGSLTVGYVTYGNPLAYDSVAQSLVREAESSGIRFETIPGISSVDTLLCDLSMDMAPGLQVYEASWLVATNECLNARTAAILLQLGTFGSVRAHYRERRPASSLAGLVAFLLRTHPRSHLVYLVQSSGGPHRARIRRVQLAEIDTVDTEDILGASLYIPPLTEAQISQEYISKMES